MNKKKYFIIMTVVIIYTVISLGMEKVSLEDLGIITGIGYDIKKVSPTEKKYVFPFSIYDFEISGKRSSHISVGEGKNVGETIETRQKQMNKTMIQGLERVFVIGQEFAENGLKPILDERARNYQTSDMAFGAICNGRSEDILAMKVQGYASSSEFIAGLIERQQGYNFFSQDYKIVDMLVRIGAEGRNLVMPYIDVKDNNIEIDGLAIFKKDKMIAVTDLYNARVLNLLRENDVKGVLSYQRSPKEYTDIYVTNKRKVKCEKKEDKYTFTIDLKLTGNITSNTLYKDILNNLEVKNEYEKLMSKKVEDMCNQFLNKMKNEYKTDCLELGREAAAKYGRRTGVDWNDIVCNSQIIVKAKVIVNEQGRGDYTK